MLYIYNVRFLLTSVSAMKNIVFCRASILHNFSVPSVSKSYRDEQHHLLQSNYVCDSKLVALRLSLIRTTLSSFSSILSFFFFLIDRYRRMTLMIISLSSKKYRKHLPWPLRSYQQIHKEGNPIKTFATKVEERLKNKK